MELSISVAGSAAQHSGRGGLLLGHTRIRFSLHVVATGFLGRVEQGVRAIDEFFGALTLAVARNTDGNGGAQQGSRTSPR